MNDWNKTKAQLIKELQDAERRISDLEQAISFTESKPKSPSADDFLRAQRDLGISLSAATSLEETFRLTLSTTISLAGMDCGGVYLVAPSGELNLIYHQGLSADFIHQVAHYPAGSQHAQMVRAGQPLFLHYPDFIRQLSLNRTEEIKTLAVIPIAYNHQIIAAINVASHTRREIPDFSRLVLETIASQVGPFIARTQKEEELQRSQQQLRTIFDSIEDFMFVVDRSGNIQDVNPVVTTRLGRSRAELIGQPVYVIHPPEYQAQAQAFIHEMLTGQRDHCLLPLVAANGTRIPVETRVFRYTSENQELLVGICRDVSARDQAEAAFKKLIEGSIQGTAIFQDGVVIFANESINELIGYTLEELRAFSTEGMLTIIHPEDREWVARDLAARMAGKYVPEQQTLRIVRKDGATRWVEIYVSTTSFQARPALQIAFIDITDRKQAEAALRESEERFKKLSDLTFEGIFLHQAGVVLDANESVVRILGYPVAELLGKNIIQLCVLPEYHARIQENIIKKFAKSYEVLVQRKDGHVLPVEIEARDVKSGGVEYRVAAIRDITERKQAEEKMRLYTAMFEASTEAIAISDPAGRLVYINPAHEKLFGYSLAEAREKNYRDYYPPESVEILTEVVAPALARGEAWEGDLLARDASGRLFPLWERADSIRDLKGNLQYAFGFMHDISDQKQAEEELRRSQALLNDSQNLSKVGGWEWNLQKQTMYWTDETYRIHGVNREEIKPGATTHIERSVECYDPADQPVIRAAFRKCVETGEAYDLEFPFTTAQGEKKWIRTTAKAGHENGRIVKVIGNIVDITERKQAEKALKESKQLLQNVIDATPACIYVKDPDGKYIFANQFIANLYGTTPEDMIGKTDLDFAEKLSLTRDEALAFIRLDQEVIRKKQSRFVNEEPFTLPDGSQRWFQTRKIPISLPDHPICLLGVSEDITERKRATDLLRESEARLARAQQIAHLGNWLWDIPQQTLIWSDELYTIFGFDPKTPLTYHGIEAAIHPEDQVKNQKFVADLLTLASSAETEFRILRSDGAVRHIYQQAQVLCDASSHVERIFGIMHDITERKEAENKLRESEEKYKAVVDNVGIGVALISPQMEILTLNRQMKQWFPQTDISKKPFCYQAFNNPPRTEICAYCPTCKTLLDGAIHEAISETPAGNQIINYRIVASPIRDAAGNIIAAIEMVEDITERKRAEDDLRESEEKYRHLFQNMAQGVFYQAADGTLLDVNATALGIFGLERDEFLSRTSFDPEWRVIHEDGSLVSGELHPSMLALRTKQPVQNATYGVFNPRLKEYVWTSVNAMPMFRTGETEPYQVFVTMHEITARKRAEDALRESEERYRTLLEAIQDSIYVLDREWRHTLVNAAATDFTLFSREQLLGNKLTELFPGIQETNFFGTFQRVMNSRVPDSVVAEYHFPDGREGWYNVQISPVPEGILCISRDISREKHAEAAVIESQKRYRALFENSPIAIWEEDFSAVKTELDRLRQTGVTNFREHFKTQPEEIGRMAGLIKLLELNQTGIKLLGATDSETVCRDLSKYFVPESLKVFEEELIALAEGLNRFESEIPVVNVQGELKQLDLSLVIPPGSEATWSRVIVSFMDITARKSVEDALRRSEAKLRLMFSNIHDVFFSVDRNGIITEISPSVEKILGYKPEELTGKHLETLNIFTPESIKQVFSDVFQLLSGETIELVVYEFIARDGSVRFAEITGSPIIVNQEVAGFTSVARDITARKRAESERNRLEMQLRRAQKLETIGTLAGGIAHDFNNILTPIMGYAELSLSGLPPADPIAEDLEQILIAANRARDLVEQILIFSRQLEKERKPLNLHLIVKEALKLLRPAIPTTVEIRQRIDSSGDKVLADAAQMHQIMVNLCTNAWQAMEAHGGTLTIELQQVQVDDQMALNHPNLKPGNYARLSVIDTGIGMDADTQERIFEPFFTTKAVGKGTGMGLPVVHGIVRSHHGEIMVHSEPGKGSTFHVFIPTVTSDTIAENPEPKPIPSGTEMVLIVDDEEPVGKMVQKLLRRLGYEVEYHQSSFNALKAFRQHPAKYDLVISDLTMPNLTGLELTQQIHRVRPDLPVIIMTGYGEILSGENQKSLGIQSILRKPISLHELAELVRKILDKN